MSRLKKYDNTAFHVHTYRCGHAGDEKEEEYIKRAISIEMDRIIFTDHGPFPGDPFYGRMKYEDLGDYIDTLRQLKNKYDGIIEVKYGLEMEYFSEYDTYYEELLAMDGLDGIILGQHMYALGEGRYSFSMQAEELDKYEAEGLAEAVISGINKNYFTVVAHPDRCFRRKTVWTKQEEMLGKQIIEAALKHDIPLERNISSMRVKHHYWQEFWDMTTPEIKYLYGLDAHCTEKLESGYLNFQKPLILGEQKDSSSDKV
jgi:Histidinol phosphatase and related hydrolases of the PHP family